MEANVSILNDIITEYFQDAEEVVKNAPPLAGVLGMKGGLSTDGCHERFYNKFSTALKENEFNPYEVVKFIISADSSYECRRELKAMLTAIQGLAIDYVPSLTAEQKAEFVEFFDKNIKKIDRVPVQVKLYKALKK